MKKRIEEPLECYSRKELQLNIMRNIEREILSCGHNSKIRIWWENVPNWAKVQKYLNGNTCKGGSTSSTQQCLFLGVRPDGRSFYGEGTDI